MTASIVINLLGLAGDICSVYVFQLLLSIPRDRLRLYWAIQMTGVVVARLLRTFVDPTIGWICLPLMLGVPVLLGEGPVFRRILIAPIGFMVITMCELPMGSVWTLLTGSTLVSHENAFAHLPTYVLLQSLFCTTIILVALAVSPLTRRFMGMRGSTRTSAIVAVLPFLHGALIMCGVRSMITSNQWGVPIFVAGTVACLMSLASTVLLIRDVQSSVDKAAADFATQAITRAADGFVERYVPLERSIELSSMIRHDIRNQLGVISELAAGDGRDQALALVGQLRREAVEASSIPVGNAVGDPTEESAEGLVEALSSHEFTQLSSDRSYVLTRAFYVVSFVALAVGVLCLFSYATPSALARAMAVLSIITGAVVMPILFRMLGEARDVDVAVERARAAESMLIAQRAHGARLEAEAAEADRVRRAVVESLDELERLVRDGNEEGLARYVEATRVRTSSARRWCEHGVVNTLMQMKAQMAQEAGVDFDGDVDVPRKIHIQAVDLCAVLSNMLDNAIEAASGAPEDRRRVHVMAAPRGGYLVIRVENGIGGGVPRVLPSTERPGVGEHGWGLRILEEFVRRHDGQLTSGVEGNVFTVQATLALGQAAGVS